jgi:hypothetical protein
MLNAEPLDHGGDISLSAQFARSFLLPGLISFCTLGNSAPYITAL